ncbi:MAG: hypothetical protein OXT49_03245, partial [Gammaproteobacteria bacterium]|nr:hypothetical protein [Gammaproteobacteria bacterium]
TVCAIGLFCCARHLDISRPVFLVITLFIAGHALGHVVEIIAGLLPHSHWYIDIPLVFLPACLLTLAALPKNWARLTQT